MTRLPDPVNSWRGVFSAGFIWSILRGSSVSRTAIASMLVQVGRPLVSLMTIPQLLEQLGHEGLGVWMIALSLIGLVGFVSSGLSTSVVTAVGRAGSAASDLPLHRLTTTATLLACGWGMIVLVTTVPTALLLNWTALLNLRGSALGTEVGQLMVALAVLLSLGLFVGVPRQIMVGRMHGYLAYLLDLAGLVAGAGMLILGLHLKAPLWILATALLAPSIVVLLAGGVFYLNRAGVPLLAWRNFDKETLRALGADSLRMAGYQSAYAISSQSDLLLIGIIVGSSASADYGVAQRVFSLPILVAAAVNYAQWPVMARADASGEHAVVRRMFGRTLVIASGAATAAAVILALAYQPLMNLWLGHPPTTDIAIVLGMVVWVAVATLVNTCDSVLRARNETALMMRSMWAMALINVATTLLLLPQVGPAGAIWGSVAGFVLGLLIPYAHRLRRLWRSSMLSQQKNADAS